MGCSTSKAASSGINQAANVNDTATSIKDFQLPPEIANIKDKGQQLYKILSLAISNEDKLVWSKVVAICNSNPNAANCRDISWRDTPLHLACRALDRSSNDIPTNAVSPEDAVRTLIRCSPKSVSVTDSSGFLPLHYALCGAYGKDRADGSVRHRSKVAQILIAANKEAAEAYLSRNDVAVGEEECTPLYHAVAMLPDDFEIPTGTTVDLIRVIHCSLNTSMVSVRNKSNYDKPLALLYRRFSRQFENSEKFFTGDNSRPEVLEFRKLHKAAAVNTWKIIITLIGPTNTVTVQSPSSGKVISNIPDFHVVHAAVQLDCPPDLLRYIIETRPDELKQVDQSGRLPLHCAAATGDSQSFAAQHFKFIMDELLYAYPDGAAFEDKSGKFPLQLAVESGKTWIGGGIKSLYDVFPDAMTKVDMNKYPTLQKAMGSSSQMAEDGEGTEEHYDAIMLVQKKDANLGDVVSTMWSNEEDGGVQLLGCIAIYDLAKSKQGNAKKTLSIAISAVSAVVNAMKNHPNEPAVQEKGCKTLALLAVADNQREINFTASAAIASIVSAMQAHVSDSIVQQEACNVLREIVKYGGSDRATIIASVSGFTAIRNAMGAHSNVVGVQRECCWLLEALTSFPDANLPNLPTLQLSHVLEGASKRFPSDCREPVSKILPRLAA